LSVDGQIILFCGALSIGHHCRKTFDLLLPAQNAAEAAIIEGVAVYGLHTLPEAVGFLRGELRIEPQQTDRESVFAARPSHDEDYGDVRGQDHAKRALEIAAAGGHNLLRVGPPGSGKTMLAKRRPTTLPLMKPEEAIETTRVHSVAVQLPSDRPILTVRPFRSPHHSISDAGLIGGGAIPRPGEVSLAHNGVLFLDESPEFRRPVLDSLRQPLEEGTVTLTRVSGSLRYPARFMLIAAMNPCPCGYYGDRSRACVCTPHQIRKYRAKLSGPLQDRIDIHIEVPPVPVRELHDHGPVPEASGGIRARVVEARERQAGRYRQDGIYTNAQLKPRLLKRYCELDARGQNLLEQSMLKLGLSARAHGRILRVARTIADLAGAEKIDALHVAEAIQYRSLDRRVDF